MISAPTFQQARTHKSHSRKTASDSSTLYCKQVKSSINTETAVTERWITRNSPKCHCLFTWLFKVRSIWCSVNPVTWLDAMSFSHWCCPSWVKDPERISRTHLGTCKSKKTMFVAGTRHVLLRSRTSCIDLEKDKEADEGYMWRWHSMGSIRLRRCGMRNIVFDAWDETGFCHSDMENLIITVESGQCRLFI